MKVIIAGSRKGVTMEDIERAIAHSDYDITEVVCGLATGADALGKEWAKANNIPVVGFPADWVSSPKFAGFARNKEMAEYADALIAICVSYSKGTLHMVKEARKHKLNIHLVHKDRPLGLF